MSTLSITARNTHTSLAISTTEGSFTIADNTGLVPAQDRILELVCPVDWGISSATGVFGSKKPLAANIPFRISTDSTVLTFYYQSSSASSNLSIWVL
jgi:hypothetical protein